MLSITGTNITITRGDSAYINVTIKDSQGNVYTPSTDDTIRAQVRQSATSTQILFESVIPSDTLVWHIKPEDTQTASLNGATYVYDMQIETADGDTFTFIPQSNFIISKEVTRDATTT